MAAGVRLWKPLSVAVLLTALWSSAALADADENLYFDVVLRGTGSATIHAGVYNNPRNKGDSIVLAVHGMTETATVYEPLANAIYSDGYLKNNINKIVAIDLVAHGLSGAPTGLPDPTTFGDLLIEDNVSVIIQAIGYLNAIGIGPDAIMGHSMGGITVQAIQEALLAQGSSLSALGVTKAALIAAVPNYGAQWTRYDSPPIPPATYTIEADPVLGMIFDNPIEFCGVNGAFTTLSGDLIPDYPTAETCIANGWMSVEPLMTVAELNGSYCAVGLCRPYTRPNAFEAQNGTVLMVLGFSQDVLCPIVDQDLLYSYLTGKSSQGHGSLFTPIVADDAVHSMYMANPAVVAKAMRKLFK